MIFHDRKPFCEAQTPTGPSFWHSICCYVAQATGCEGHQVHLRLKVLSGDLLRNLVGLCQHSHTRLSAVF